MTGSTRLRRAAWIFAVTSLLYASPVRAEDEAVSRFERGVQLYEAENYEGALVEFNTAYKLSKNYKLLYNIGICQNATRDYAAAVESFTKYLVEGGSEISDARKNDVNDRLSKLALTVAKVRVTTDAPSGSTILVDDQSVGTTPLDSIVVKIGRRQIGIRSGDRSATKTIELSSGEQNAAVTLLLSDRNATGRSADTTDPRSDSGASFPWPFWGLTAVLGGAAAITGVLAVNARNDLGDKEATFGVQKSSLEDDASKAKTLGIVTDVLLATTILSAGFATYMTVRYFGKKKNASAQLPPPRVQGWSLSPMGIGYTRSF